MKTFLVTEYLHGSRSVTVEAESWQEAIEASRKISEDSWDEDMALDHREVDEL